MGLEVTRYILLTFTLFGIKFEEKSLSFDCVPLLLPMLLAKNLKTGRRYPLQFYRVKIVEALRGAFSTSMELKRKGTGGGGAGREMIDSNTSLPSILTPKHFLLFLRPVLRDRI